jgi:hypothetical protein
MLDDRHPLHHQGALYLYLPPVDHDQPSGRLCSGTGYTVTAAACEEAFCEVDQFVPCVGATRSRMYVTSTIVRPGAQSCGIVDVVWEDLFLAEDASR